jgi:hypothetical protein
MTQFAVKGGGGFFECVAISETDDATGSWFRYAFSYDQLPDYPKVGVWPDASQQQLLDSLHFVLVNNCSVSTSQFRINRNVAGKIFRVRSANNS